MVKELIICIIIIVLIIIGNVITQNYTNNSVDEAIKTLCEFRGRLFNDNIDWENLKTDIEKFQRDWEKRHSKLAYYIEHDELEKVETSISGLNGYIQVEEEKEAVAELDRNIYILKHIKNKTIFNLENIF